MGCPRFLISLIALTGLSLSCSGVLAHAAIIEGVDATQEQFPEVFSMTHSENLPKLCTATLIDPRILITAAHCLPENETLPVSVSNALDGINPALKFTSSHTFRHPKFVATNENEVARTGYDVGIIILAEPIVGVVPTLLGSLQDRTQKDIAFNSGVTVAGYGGNKSVYQDMSTGTKRFATSRALEVSPKLFTTDGEYGALSHGDSGGPAYVINAAGIRKLVGVASGVPEMFRLYTSGRPSVSYYAGMREEVARWIRVRASSVLSTTPKVKISLSKRPVFTGLAGS